LEKDNIKQALEQNNLENK